MSSSPARPSTTATASSSATTATASSRSKMVGGGWWPRRKASRPTVAAAMANTSTAASTANNQTTGPHRNVRPPPAETPAVVRHAGRPGLAGPWRGCTGPGWRDDRPVVAPTTTAALVGRTAELDALIADCARATRGEGTTALVGGEAGVGKSRLVAELAARARHQGARVLVGQCLDLEEGGLPYAPVVDILRALERELTADEGAATLAPLRAMLGRAGAATAPDDPAPAGDAPPAGQVGQARLFELLLTVIERLLHARPLVLVLEDLH